MKVGLLPPYVNEWTNYLQWQQTRSLYFLVIFLQYQTSRYCCYSMYLIQQWSRQDCYAVAKMTAQCALYMGALKIFGTLWLRPRLIFPTFFVGFCSDRPYECSYKIWSPYIALSDNREYPKIWTISGYAHAPFSPTFLMAFIRIGPVNVPAKFEDRSFTCSWDKRG